MFYLYCRYGPHVVRFCTWHAAARIACLVLLLLTAYVAHAHDFEHGPFAQYTPKEQQWLKQQKRPGGGSLCCSEADGEQVDEEIRAGRYWVNSSKTRGEWLLVPTEAVILQPNPQGRPVAWYRWVSPDGSFSSSERKDLKVEVFCFAPGPLL